MNEETFIALQPFLTPFYSFPCIALQLFSIDFTKNESETMGWLFKSLKWVIFIKLYQYFKRENFKEEF